LHVLIIEDDAMIAMLVEDELRDLGYSSFEIATTEDAAIESAARTRPDLVISDGVLLAGSGLVAARKIYASYSVPVIFITGDPHRARRCFPGLPVLSKPFSFSELACAVQRAAPNAPRALCASKKDELRSATRRFS
jgi:DNA-binding response OmpR family regulator